MPRGGHAIGPSALRALNRTRLASVAASGMLIGAAPRFASCTVARALACKWTSLSCTCEGTRMPSTARSVLGTANATDPAATTPTSAARAPMRLFLMRAASTRLDADRRQRVPRDEREAVGVAPHAKSRRLCTAEGLLERRHRPQRERESTWEEPPCARPDA